MIELNFETAIRAAPEQVFDLLADLRDYDRWLPRSPAFRGTTEISPGAIGVGTSYIERSPFGIRRGQVTEYERPTRLGFEQPMALGPRGLGEIGIRLAYRLRPEEGLVHVHRRLVLSPSGIARLVLPFALGAFRAENVRVMEMLKRAAEAAQPNAAS